MFTLHLITQLFQLPMKMEMLFLGHLLVQKDLKVQEKSTPYAAQVAADDAGAKAFEKGLRTLSVHVKGPGSGREKKYVGVY